MRTTSAGTGRPDSQQRICKSVNHSSLGLRREVFGSVVQCPYLHHDRINTTFSASPIDHQRPPTSTAEEPRSRRESGVRAPSAPPLILGRRRCPPDFSSGHQSFDNVATIATKARLSSLGSLRFYLGKSDSAGSATNAVEAAKSLSNPNSTI